MCRPVVQHTAGTIAAGEGKKPGRKRPPDQCGAHAAQAAACPSRGHYDWRPEGPTQPAAAAPAAKWRGSPPSSAPPARARPRQVIVCPPWSVPTLERVLTVGRGAQTYMRCFWELQNRESALRQRHFIHSLRADDAEVNGCRNANPCTCAIADAPRHSDLCLPFVCSSRPIEPLALAGGARHHDL